MIETNDEEAAPAAALSPERVLEGKLARGFVPHPLRLVRVVVLEGDLLSTFKRINK